MTETASATDRRPATGEVEQRSAPVQTAPPTLDGRRLRGVIPYGVESRDMGGWREVMQRGSLSSARTDDLVCTVDHAGVPLARFPTTLEVEDRDDGLHWSLDLPESRADVREAVERGDLRATSWRMVVGRDEWRGDVRHVAEVAELRDVSLVTNPAYSEARAEYRNAPDTTTENTTTAAERQEENMSRFTGTFEGRQADDADNPDENAPEQRDQGGGLAVEDRTAASAEPTVEERVLDSLRNVRKGETRSLTTTSADAIAPPELSSFLFDKLRASSVALQSGIVVIPTDRESIQFPKVTADVNPAWYAETDLILPGDPTLVTLTATPRKLAHIVELSNEVIDDSEPSIVNVLNGHLATVLGLKLDRAIFEGTGTGDEPLGLANVAGIQTGPAPDTYDAFIEAVGMLQAVNAPGPYVAVGPPSVFTDLALLKNGTLSEQLPAPAQMPTVYASTQVASVYVYSAAQVVLVRRQDATIELDRSRLFNQDMSELRGKLRADVLAPNPSAIVELPVVAGI